MKLAANKPCPCHSGRKAKSCCGPILAGLPASSPEALMRSRYTAYAVGHVSHIMKTTHPSGPHHQEARGLWHEQIEAFCRATSFERLRIHGSGEDDSKGWVKFTAHLTQDGQDASFTEHSLFLRSNGHWLYHSAITD